MDEELKKQVAVFRFGVIADFVDGTTLSRGETKTLMREKCDRMWRIPGSGRTRISKSVIKEWIVRYKRSGNKLEALYPQGRSDLGKTRAIDDDTASGLIKLREELPAITLPTLLREAKERKIVLPGREVAYSTLYRFLTAKGLADRPDSAPRDRRKFEAEHPNDLCQSDVMHGPMVLVDGKQKKTYLIGFIDDMTRLIPHAEFYLHERLECFLDAFRKALLMRGLPKKLYVDNGPAFRSHHLEHICASLGIQLIHAKPYQPEGKGKIERWHRTVREGFLATLKPTDLAGLNEQFSAWLAEYHERPHRGTGVSPIRRFTQNIECVRPAPRDMEDHFRKPAKRTVAKDRTFTIQGRLYEAPVDLVKKQIRLLYHEHDPARVEMRLGEKTYGFAKVVDLHVNCRVKRETSPSDSEAKEKYKGGNLFTKKAHEEGGA